MVKSRESTTIAPSWGANNTGVSKTVMAGAPETKVCESITNAPCELTVLMEPSIVIVDPSVISGLKSRVEVPITTFASNGTRNIDVPKTVIGKTSIIKVCVPKTCAELNNINIDFVTVLICKKSDKYSFPRNVL